MGYMLYASIELGAEGVEPGTDAELEQWLDEIAAMVNDEVQALVLPIIQRAAYTHPSPMSKREINRTLN